MKPLKSKYIVFPKPLEIALEEEEITPPEPGEILCAAEKSLVSIGTELSCLRGEADPGTNWHDWLKYPFRPGYSMVAKVIAAGAGVERYQPGQRLTTYDHHQQYFKIQTQESGKEYNTPLGEGIIQSLPDEISSEDATWRSLAITTQNAVRRASFQFGETACVVGLGILGQLVTQYLAAAGARRIIAVDTVASRLALAKQHGATHTLQMDAGQAVEAIREITEGWMSDVVFDVTGHPAALAPCIQLARRLGRLVLLGDTPKPTEQRLGPGVVSNAIAILGIHGYTVPERTTEFTPWTIETMSALFFDYVRRGKMHVADLITKRCSPLDAPQLYADLLNNRSGQVGIIFDWTTLPD